MGFINESWHVADLTTGTRYLLRRYVRVRDVERVSFQLSLQEHLFIQGFPTPAIIHTNEDRLFTSTNDTHWALFRFIDGREFDFTRPTQAREAGKRLAQFERIAEGYAGPVVAPPLDEATTRGASLSALISQALILSDEHEDLLRALHTDAEYADDLSFFSRWRRAAAEAWPVSRLSTLPEAWLHCDYHGRNMVFQADKLAGLFDFDFVTRGPRVYDIGRGLFVFGREGRGAIKSVRAQFCRAFLDGYESEQTLTDEERRSLAYMAVLNCVPGTPFDASRHADVGPSAAGTRFRLCIEMMRIVQAEMNRLAPEVGWDRT
jgi:Ser/Thr protein kinase RdoA (MazF antagonist)